MNIPFLAGHDKTVPATQAICKTVRSGPAGSGVAGVTGIPEDVSRTGSTGAS